MHKTNSVFDKYSQSIADYMEGSLPPYSPHTPHLEEAMLYSLIPTGKAIRPLLALSSYKLFAHSHREAIPMATCIEMLHTYTLVHDDLPSMDNDAIRRGRASTHVAYSDWLATLAGDALLTKAFEIMSSNTRFNSDVRINAIAKLAQYAGHTGLIAGQVADMSYSLAGMSTMSNLSKESVLEFIHTNKTAALFRYSCELGGILAEASPRDTSTIALFGEKLGLAFQIYDDIEDSSSHQDDDKLTYPSVVGLSESTKLYKQLLAESLALLDNFAVPAYNSEALADLITLANSIGNEFGNDTPDDTPDNTPDNTPMATP